MSIWKFAARSTDPKFVHLAAVTERCLFCHTDLTLVRVDSNDNLVNSIQHIWRRCTRCKWWTVRCIHDDLQIWSTPRNEYAAAAVLREFDGSGLSEPLSEIRRYLTARYDARFEIHPRRFEEVVASVFREIGYETVVTGYSADNGIDIILTGSDNRQAGVQVKRSKNSIKVEALRALTGALVLHDLAAGVFVTTSRFERGAARTAALASVRGIAIELMDARRFYDALSSVDDLSKTDDDLPQLGIVDMSFLRSDRYSGVAKWLAALNKEAVSQGYTVRDREHVGE